MGVNRELNEFEQHKTPMAVAEYFLSGEGDGVGRSYKTHEELWHCPDSVRQTGLLELILVELRKVKKPECPLLRHREWLNRWKPRIDELCKRHAKAVARVLRFHDDQRLSRDFDELDVDYLILLWGRRSVDYYRLVTDFGDSIKRLEAVKSVEDMRHLAGVGKKKMAKILESTKKA